MSKHRDLERELAELMGEPLPAAVPAPSKAKSAAALDLPAAPTAPIVTSAQAAKPVKKESAPRQAVPA